MQLGKQTKLAEGARVVQPGPEVCGGQQVAHHPATTVLPKRRVQVVDPNAPGPSSTRPDHGLSHDFRVLVEGNVIRVRDAVRIV